VGRVLCDCAAGSYRPLSSFSSPNPLPPPSISCCGFLLLFFHDFAISTPSLSLSGLSPVIYTPLANASFSLSPLAPPRENTFSLFSPDTWQGGEPVVESRRHMAFSLFHAPCKTVFFSFLFSFPFRTRPIRVTFLCRNFPFASRFPSISGPPFPPYKNLI